VDRFADGDPDNNTGVDTTDPHGWHGGDLTGVIENLDHIQEMGFKTVWLSPVFESRDAPFFEWGAFHGYWVDRLDEIDERFGDWGQLRALSDALHDRDMRLMIDVVYNHVSFDSPLLAEHPDWFHPDKPIEDWNDPVQLRTHQVAGLPDLDQSHPQVRAYLRDSTVKWMRLGHVDGLRIDAVRHMDPTQLSVISEEIEQTVGAEIDTIGEIYDGGLDPVLSGWAEGEFGGVFDFPLHFAMVDSVCAGGRAGRLAAALDADRDREIPGRWVGFLDNHDLPRISTACNLVRVDVALVTLMTARGTPMITYGTESDLSGEGEPDNRGNMNFAFTPRKELITTLLKIRSENRSLITGKTQIIGLYDDGLIVLRWGEEDTTLVGLNFGDQSIEFDLPDWLAGYPWTQVLGGYEASVGLFVPPRAGTVIGLNQPVTPPSGHRLVQWEVVGDSALTSLKLVGASPGLGAWDPASAPHLVSQRFEMDVEFGSVMEYKIVADGPDGSVMWEPGANRYTLVDSGEGPMKIQLDVTGLFLGDE